MAYFGHDSDGVNFQNYFSNHEPGSIDIDIGCKSSKMDSFQHDGLLNDPWQGSDDLLENIFSLEHGSLNFLEESLPEFNLNVDTISQPPDVPGSSSSDSGLSSDPAEFDFEQQLSPFLIQNSCEDDLVGSVLDSSSPGNQDVVVQEYTNSSSSNSETEEPFNMLDFERNVVPGFINHDAFQSPGKVNRKRRLSQSPPLAAPKVQKQILKVTSSGPGVIKPQFTVKSQPHKPVKLTNIQLVNPPTKVYSKPVETAQRKVIRVSPVAGNPRSILLPVTIKDMKDLKSIKIINAADLKNASNIKFAAANLLTQSKLQDFKVESTTKVEYDYEVSNGGNCDDSGTDHSDDEELDQSEMKNRNGGYPRLVLTAEERRLLAKEGITLPSSYPLTKHEERELKRIRRKIRNKISAQDSRKRKKEYVDGLEDRVKQCTVENQTLIKRIKLLQSQNHTLSAQLKRLQNVLTSPNTSAKSAQPATCLLVLLLSVALVALPSFHDEPPKAPPATSTPSVGATSALRRALLSVTNKLSRDETVINDGEFNMDDLLTINIKPHVHTITHFDHDYQLIKNSDPKKVLPDGYLDLPIDDDWPTNHKKRMKYDFDYDEGKDYLPPIVKEENYQNFYKVNTKLDTYKDNVQLMIDKKFDTELLKNTLLTAGRKLEEYLDLMPPIPVNNEDLVIEEVQDFEDRNSTEIQSFVVNGSTNI